MLKGKPTCQWIRKRAQLSPDAKQKADHELFQILWNRWQDFTVRRLQHHGNYMRALYATVLSEELRMHNVADTTCHNMNICVQQPCRRPWQLQLAHVMKAPYKIPACHMNTTALKFCVITLLKSHVGSAQCSPEIFVSLTNLHSHPPDACSDSGVTTSALLWSQA